MRAAILFLAAFAVSVQAGEIYRWVDENGKTHVSDVVPEKYKGSARLVSPGREPTPEERRAAEERARLDRERATQASPARAAQSAPPEPQAQAESDCERAHRLYKESQECFMPYRNANGSIRSEAFQRCAQVPDPSTRCGPVKPESSERRY